MDSKELVYKTLDFAGPERVPRNQWTLPWAEMNYPEELQKIRTDFPDDFITSPGYNREFPKMEGDPYEIGTFVDHWGCKFTNVQRGVIGEIKEALIQRENFEDIDKLRIPEENLTIDIDKVNEFCTNSNKFILAGACPRPFERLQFIRKTEQLYVDLMVQSEGLMHLIEKMHDYYCRLLNVWAKTNVDALMFMDDWGAQRGLLISPKIWVRVFKPMYQDYIDIAHSHNKKIFMHSDGHILEIIPHLIEMGLNAVNSQLFCMGLDNLKQFRGKITFWGEIDRQHLLPYGSLQDIDEAVRSVKDALWMNGGCIAQCEFGAGAKPENVYRVYEAWNNILMPDK
jgi:hypothetical protein